MRTDITMLIALLTLSSVYSISQSCPTCLAKLRQQDKPFFIRDISAQIAASQDIRSNLKKEPSEKAVEKKPKVK